MILMLSTNLNHIRRVYSKDMTVATSIVSAEIQLKRNKYSLVIKDGIDYDVQGIKCMTYEEYLKEHMKLEEEKPKEATKPLAVLNALKEKSTVKTKTRSIYRQEVVSVWSVKGGIGKTTLAKALAESVPKELKVLLVDLNFADGGADLSFIYNLPQLPHIGMYLKEKDNLNKYVISVSSNIYVLQAPPKVSLVSTITANDITQLANDARLDYDLILFDLPHIASDVVREALNRSTKVLVLTSADESELARIHVAKTENMTVVICRPHNRSWKKYMDVLNMPYVEVHDVKNDVDLVLDKIYG
ncbi:Cellulose biosynthesis protein BcsQ [Caldanaerobius fijiensis DSM 17918]|uniref:Cellulose biosynthesis protein BcsQ n=1 Tax=Caldanaerobius fijiensis DSM 17918 TaxID=1121256 RepID=A0A1M5FQL7_9THEO|nr:cellulose synthase operon protein YhjQ/BcsQ [Caldanaerobius fijiensis]SHF93472.1 Cellulose biosynthesis protein BcsQ [Caldanaerobius fijiensis DSM 17918]